MGTSTVKARAGRIGAAGAVALLMSLAGAPTTAMAATNGVARVDDGAHAVYYAAGQGFTNEVAITDGPGAGESEWLTRIDDRVPITAGTGCRHPNAADKTVVECLLHEFGDFWIRIDIRLGDRNDRLLMDAGNENTVRAGSGNDVLRLTGHETAYGEAGNDLISGAAIAKGGDGNDRITIITSGSAYGDDGSDVLLGDERGDMLAGGPGDDQIVAAGGKDVVFGNSGDDLIRGGTESDQLSGGPGDDVIYGNSGNDLLIGGPGTDQLSGGPGRNTIR